MSSFLFFFRRISRSLSFRAGLYAILAIVASLAAVFAAPIVPDGLAEVLGGKAVDDILTVMASSMLAVVTFSLSTLVSSFGAVASTASPRATALIMEDRRAHTALATFLGAFIFSVVSIVALSTGYYGPKGRVILFFITALVLAGVLYTIIRWIGQLSGLSRLGNVVDQIEEAGSKAILAREVPFAWEPRAEPPAHLSAEVCGAEIGFLQAIDIRGLAELTKEYNVDIFVHRLAGEFMHPHSSLAHRGAVAKPEEFDEKIRACFRVGHVRTFDDDPRFGFTVLSEVGSRALSPGINDPGSAIHAIASLARLVHLCLKPRPPESAPNHPRLYLRAITAAEILDDAFRAIGRDAASMAEVSSMLQRALAALGAFPEFLEPAKEISRENINHCHKAMDSEFDLARVKASAGKLLEA